MDYPDKIETLKRNVTLMLREQNERSPQRDGQPLSPIWSQALSVLEYAVHLFPEDFLNIRFHTDLFTGDYSYGGWHSGLPNDSEEYARESGYEFYTEDIPEDYWVSEPEVPGTPIPGDCTEFQVCSKQVRLRTTLI